MEEAATMFLLEAVAEVARAQGLPGDVGLVSGGEVGEEAEAP